MLFLLPRRQSCDNFPQLVKILGIEVQNCVAMGVGDCVLVSTVIESKFEP